MMPRQASEHNRTDQEATEINQSAVTKATPRKKIIKLVTNALAVN